MKIIFSLILLSFLAACGDLLAKHSGNPDGISQDVYDQTHGRNNVSND